MGGVFAPNLGDDRGFGGESFEPLEGVRSSLFRSEGGDVGEFGVEKVGATGVGNDATEGQVRDAFHGRKDRDWFFEFVPNIKHVMYIIT